MLRLAAGGTWGSKATHEISQIWTVLAVTFRVMSYSRCAAAVRVIGHQLLVQQRARLVVFGNGPGAHCHPNSRQQAVASASLVAVTIKLTQTKVFLVWVCSLECTFLSRQTVKTRRNPRS